MTVTSAKMFKRGQLVRASAEFRKNDGTNALVDPTPIRLVVKKPGTSPQISTYTYGVGIAIIKDATGQYHSDLSLDIGGVWHTRWEADGTWQAAEEMTFNVKSGAFT